MYDIVIIGGGPAGYTAGLYGARAGLSVLLLEKLAPGGQMATSDKIDNYPGFPDGINGFELGMLMKKSADRFGVKTVTAEVKSVELKGEIKKITTAKETYEAKNVIISAGARPRLLGLDNEKQLIGKGVSYCATCDGMFFKDKDVAVVGGGYTAVSDVQYLAKICKKVYLIHRRDKLRASGAQMEELKKLPNVELVLNSEVKELVAENDGGRLSALRLKSKDGEESQTAVQGVFIAIGNIPNTELFKDELQLDEYGYIVADETTRTNIEGVFAAGDIRKKPLRQVVTATADGANAASQAEQRI